MLLTLTVCLCSPALASASTSKAFKCRVVTHGRHADVVKCRGHRLLVRDHHRYVKVHGVRRYRVVKRHYRYVVLRAVSASAVAVPGNTPISAGTAEPAGLPATASSVQTGYLTSWGNDWQTATRWSASTRSYPQWWMVDLGSCKTVTGVQTDWFNGAKRAYRYRVETSLDGFTFITAADRSKNRTRGVTTDAMSAPARYVRVQVLGASVSGAWASANEVTVYAEATPTPPPTPEPTPTPTPTDTRRRRPPRRRRRRRRRPTHADAHPDADDHPHAHPDADGDADSPPRPRRRPPRRRRRRPPRRRRRRRPRRRRRRRRSPPRRRRRRRSRHADADADGHADRTRPERPLRDSRLCRRTVDHHGKRIRRHPRHEQGVFRRASR